MIEVERLTKQYRSLVAVRDLTFKVSQGSVSGLLGSNGAGKTTTLRMLAGVLGPTRGLVRLCGYDLIAQPLQARRCLGYLPETTPLYLDLTARQYLSYRIGLKGIDRLRRKTSLTDAARKAGCDQVLDVRIRSLSKGYRQRVGLADVLLANPPILLLDEPTTGLDPNQVLELRELVARLRDEHAIIISTHVLSEVEALCTHALVMHAGRIIANDSIESLQSRHGGAEIEMRLTDPHGRAAAIFAKLGWRIHKESPDAARSQSVTPPPSVSDIRADCSAPRTDTEAAIERLIAALVDVGIGVRHVSRVNSNLQSVFTALTEAERTKS